MIRRGITVAAIVAILAVIVYDLAIYAAHTRELSAATYTLTQSATAMAQTSTREQTGVELARIGSQQGIEVYQYDQTDRRVRVWTRTRVGGTLVLGGIWNLFDGVAPADAFGRPFAITDYREAGIL